MNKTSNKNNELTKTSELTQGGLLVGLDGSALAKAILNSDIPEKLIQNLPAQALYMAIQANALEDSQELITASTPEQYQLMLDFELWSEDKINEHRLFNWIKIIDNEQSIIPLARFIKQIDQRLVAALVCKYIDAEVNEEQTNPPSNMKAYTPDHGYTWIAINSGDPENDRIIGRILTSSLQKLQVRNRVEAAMLAREHLKG